MNANLTWGLTVALCAAVLAQAPAEQISTASLKSLAPILPRNYKKWVQ